MEKVVYILGAGFSAPLGLPVMSNFIEKSKDMYFKEKDKYKHFEDVYKEIEKLSTVKKYYDSDLFNIEEILSIFETEKYVGKSSKNISFIDFIADVISYFTPKFDLINNASIEILPNWFDRILGNDYNLNLYGKFISNIQNLNFKIKTKDAFGLNNPRVQCEKKEETKALYSIITLNYDTIIEELCAIMNSYSSSNNAIDLDTHISEKSNVWENLRIAKLHGSIDKNNIIPPTWNKTIVDENIQNAWKLAFNLLKEANHIRIIGYSLPNTDSYVKYLFKSAFTQDSHLVHLKKIDVMCLDDMQNNVEKRYNSFINFNNFRYKNIDFIKFLEFFDQQHSEKYITQTKEISWNKLEELHEEFFNNN